MHFRVRFKVSIVTAILLIIAVMTFATLGNVWLVSSRTAEKTAGRLFESVTQSARQRLDRLADGILSLANLGATQARVTTISGNGLDAPSLPLLLTALKGNPSLYSLYYGFEDGSFLQVISAEGEGDVLAAHDAPDGTHWIVRTISSRKSVSEPAKISHARRQTFTFLNQSLQPIGKKIDRAPSYDPRKRPWYESAISNETAQLSAPYVFNSLQQPGLTASKRIGGGGGVFGVDVTLTELSGFISSLNVSENGGIILTDDEGRVLSMASHFGAYQLLSPLKAVKVNPVQALALAKQIQVSDEMVIVDFGGAEMMVHQSDWHTGNRSFQIAAVAPLSDFATHIQTMQVQILSLVFLGLGILIPVAFVYSNRMGKSVAHLAADANRVRNFDFSGSSPRPSRILEFDELGQSFALMKSDLSSRTKALEISDKKLSRLVELGVAMSAEHNSDKLMEMILRGAKELTNAEGGSLYTIGNDNELHFQIVQGDGFDLKYGDKDNKFPPVPLFEKSGEPNYRNVVSYAIHEGKTVNIPDAYDCDEFDFSGTRVFDERNNYRSISFLTVPLRPRGGDVIGAVQLINAREPESDSDSPVPFPSEIQKFVEALAAQAATALYNRDLLDEQENLMDSMIQLIAGAIDTKSPYTGGHCARVPELAIMLAEEACEAEEGTLADFSFKSDAEWREFRIGAWLHDCGKVVTPEYVIDKATKLETIYNRIHEVRMRFEVLLRDADIKRLEAVAAGADPEEAQDQFELYRSKLMEEFAFIAHNNIGGEFVEAEAVERIEDIGNQTWQRHFDDRLGLSHFELLRYSDVAPELPVAEKLLDDKPNHIFKRNGGGDKMYADLGFKMNVPEHLYNLGELHNLSISRGTLTEEERFKINEHIIQTIAMLEHLPFPKHLRRVPEYAGTHHETLNGEGYPRKLTGKELSVPSRIMAIADVFEALTSSDRPYKKAKTLSESVKILSYFKKDGHIDPELFDLFLTSGVYQHYAERYLESNQIDDVDIEQYIG